MTLFAITMPASLLLVGELAFTLYVLLSFVAVTKCTLRKNAAGRLINGRAAPMSLSIPPSGAWLFAYNVLALIFAQSLLYLGVMMTAIVLFWAVAKRRVKGATILPQMGAWLFIFNVCVLLWIQSPLYMVLIVMSQAVLLIENNRTAQAQFGLNRLTSLQLVKWSVLICGAVVVVDAPVLQISQIVFDLLHLSHPEQESVEVFKQVTRRSQIVDFLIQAVLIAPLVEELFFRGFLLTYLKKHLTTWGAILISAALFAVAHQNLDSMLPLWVLGIVLGVAYEHTGSLLLPMGIHACFNLTTGLTLLAQKASS